MYRNLESIIGAYGERLFRYRPLENFFGIPTYVGKLFGNVLGYVEENNRYFIRRLRNGAYKFSYTPRFVAIDESVLKRRDGYSRNVFYHEKGHILYNSFTMELKEYGEEYSEFLAEAYAVKELEREGKLGEYLRDVGVYTGEHWMMNIVLGYARTNGSKYLGRLLGYVKRGAITVEDMLTYVVLNTDEFYVAKKDLKNVLRYFRRLGFRIKKDRDRRGEIYRLIPTNSIIERYNKVESLLRNYIAS